MTPIQFKIIASLILFGLTALCFWLPYKCGKKEIGQGISLIFGFLILLTLIGNLDFLAIFLWPVILVFQIIFIIYWIFRLFGRKKLGIISTMILTIGFLLVVMQPWIIDWTFNEKDTREILSWQNIKLQDDFKILKNESGGFTDYYQTFTLKISKSDYSQIADKIRTADSYIKIIDSTNQIPNADYKSTDTINYETKNYITREYYTEKRKKDGTYHFTIQLSKKKRKLNYIGSNE